MLVDFASPEGFFAKTDFFNNPKRQLNKLLGGSTPRILPKYEPYPRLASGVEHDLAAFD